MFHVHHIKYEDAVILAECLFLKRLAVDFTQNDAVNNYMSQYPSALPAAGSFNSSNRAYPDVSAIGHNLMGEHRVGSAKGYWVQTRFSF